MVVFVRRMRNYILDFKSRDFRNMEILINFEFKDTGCETFIFEILWRVYNAELRNFATNLIIKTSLLQK